MYKVLREEKVNQNVTLDRLTQYFKRSPQARDKHKTYKRAEQARPASRDLQGKET